MVGSPTNEDTSGSWVSELLFLSIGWMSPHQTEVGVSVQAAVASLSGLFEPHIFLQKVVQRLRRNDAQVYFLVAGR